MKKIYFNKITIFKILLVKITQIIIHMTAFTLYRVILITLSRSLVDSENLY